MAYIPLIKTTKWIDLSDEHKKLRETIEQDTKNACVEGGQIQPIMLQGAFGIGKTNSLYYLFHYGWSVLQTPTFYLSLDDIVKRVKEYVEIQPSGKMQNSQLSGFINNIIIEQIESLKNNDWDEFTELYFPELNKNSLSDYLVNFHPVEIVGGINYNQYQGFLNPLTENTIRTAIESKHRPLLLIDEFESKFYELKKYIETSGGGVLRELFDNIVHDSNLFYLVIGNGPASGYEVAKERGDDATDSETAANRRLKTKSIPFSTVNLLKQSFLKDEDKGYINFIWWLSRCRPGHILKLKDTLGNHTALQSLNFSEFITKPIFKEPIDDGGEAVTYLKTAFFNDIPGAIQNKFLKNIILNLEPQQVDITNDKPELKESIPYFYCASDLVSTEFDLLPQLHKDIYESCLKKYQEDGKYESVNYIEHLQPYFNYILNAISDKDGQIAFGMINDSKSDEVLAEIFLNPLLELTYDFISQYQDDSIKETKETLDFLLNFISKISKGIENEELENLVPNTFDLFEKCKLIRNSQVYLQLSLFSIRESVEQPIGSPVLKYKNEQITECFTEINENSKFPLIYQKENNLHVYIIPDLKDDLLKIYIAKLKDYLFEIFYDKFHKDGYSITRILYFSENELIEEFRNELIKDSEENDEPAYTLKKVDVINIEKLQLNFESQIKDYVDSVAKIGIIGVNRNELEAEDKSKAKIIGLKEIIKIIGERPWTDKKETLRTIEHYRKLFFDGDNSVLKNIYTATEQEYKAELSKQVCNNSDFWSNINDYSYLDTIVNDEAEDYDKFSANLALLYLIENKTINDSLKKLLDLVEKEYRIHPNKENVVTKLNFNTLFKILTKDKENLKTHNDEFDLSSDFLLKLYTFTQNMLKEDELKDINMLYNFLDTEFESHWIQTYHEEMGAYSVKNLTKLLYSLAYIKTLNYNDLKNDIESRVNEIDKKLEAIRSEIVERLENLQKILNENEALSSYPEKLSKLKKGLTYIKSFIDNNISCSGLLIANSLLEHLNSVLNNANRFSSQLEDIYKKIGSKKDEVDIVQDKIDEIYSDSLSEKLISFEYQTKRNNEYLWKRTYLKENLKQSDEYEKLWGENKGGYYNPFTQSVIADYKITNLNGFLTNTSSRLLPMFNDTLNKLKEKQEMVNRTKELNNYISELLNTEEND